MNLLNIQTSHAAISVIKSKRAIVVKMLPRTTEENIKEDDIPAICEIVPYKQK